jgi:transcriptional antiterminator RfaH
MPLLESEPQCYPEDLWESVAAIEPDPSAELRDLELGRKWWVMRTRTRQEKSLARELLKREIPFFLPLVPKTSIVRGRKRTARLPLFSGYLFMFGNEAQRYASLTTNRVAQVLPVTEQAELGRDLRQVYRLIQLKAPLTMESRLKQGDRVRVKSGPFAGVEGNVIARCRRSRIIVGVRLIQQGVSLEVDDCQLELI